MSITMTGTHVSYIEFITLEFSKGELTCKILYQSDVSSFHFSFAVSLCIFLDDNS